MSGPASVDAPAPTRVAVDLLGGDNAPEAVVDGCLLAVDEDPTLAVTLVGPVDVAERLLAERGRAGQLAVAGADEVVGMDENPARAVRAKGNATVRVAARLVRDGEADALVSVGSTGAALAASIFTLGKLPGLTRSPLAVVMPTPGGPVVLLDAGATVEAEPDLLAQFALAGATYARVLLGIAHPRVGLLSNGSETGKGDPARKAAFDGLAATISALPAEFVGNVEGHDAALGGRADVIVTDGFTGNVLLKGIEGSLVMVAEAIRAADAAGADGLLQAFADATAGLDPDRTGGAVLLGVQGVVVVGHGSASPRAVASCVQLAAASARDGLVAQIATGLADFVARRRSAAGLSAQVGAGAGS
jgi:glycerol-3-phosphate acyltransferase PlsX